MKMKLTLIRHGQTQGNIERRFSGCRTDEPLTDAGRAALCAVGGSGGSGGIGEGSMVFVSPMIRARETAEILFPGLEKTVIEDLKEMDFGMLEPHNHEELDGDPDYQAWIDSGGLAEIPGGESIASFSQRAMRGLAAAVRQAASSTSKEIYAVAHGGTIMAIMSSLTGRAYYDFMSDNGCGYTVELEVDDAGNIVAAGAYDRFRGGIRDGSCDR